MHAPRWLGAVALCVFLAACGSGKSAMPSHNQATPGGPGDPTPAQLSAPERLAGLPTDGVQPWEHLDADGHVVAPKRGVSLVNASSVFSTGADTFLTGGSVTVVGEVERLTAGTGGNKKTSYGMYRLPLGGDQPGAVVLDVNIDSSGSSYYVALSDFESGRWQWCGPFTRNQVRLVKVPGQLVSSNYVSALGNMFVCVATFDGGRVDVIGVGTEPVTAGDPALPPAPTAFTATSVAGGLLLDWTPGVLSDLAGYRVLWSNSTFTTATDAGVHTYGYAEPGHNFFLPTTLQRTTYVAVQTVDLAGNLSDLTPVQNALPGGGNPLNLAVKLSAPNVTLGTALKLTATGSTTYDMDLDNDGVYEVQGAANGVVNLDTSHTGLYRVNVFGHGASPSYQALDGASLIISGNTPPEASADANPLSGATPLQVTLTATASDAEDPPTALTYAWDYNGDGLFEPGTNSLVLHRTYGKAGIYNATFKVTDSLGASTTAQVPINVSRGADNVPTAVMLVTAQQNTQPFGLSYNFDASASTDLDGDTLTAKWDYDGSGLGGSVPATQVVNHLYPNMGAYLASVQVDDGFGGKDTTSQTVYVPSACCSLYGAPKQYTRQSPIVGSQTSNLKWAYRTGSYILSSPVIGPKGNVYVTCDDSKLYSLVDNGTFAPTVKWRFTCGAAIDSTPAVGIDGTVYVGSSDHNVYAIHENGQAVPDVHWSFLTNDVVVASPTIGTDGTVYVASDDFNVYALKDNGTLTPDVKWSFTTGSAVEASPAIGPDGTVYVGSFDRNIYALVDNGTPTPDVKWSFLTNGAILSSVAIGPDGTIYVGSFDNWIYALKDNGTPTPDVKWSFETGAGILASPAVGANGVVYVGSEDGTLYALKDNGTPTPDLKWSFVTGGPILGSSPTIGADNTIYIGSSDKKIYALIDNGTPTPTITWSYTTLDIVNGSGAIGPDGRVYFGGEDNYVYAFGP